MPTSTGAPWNLRSPIIGESANGPDSIGMLAGDVDAALDVLKAQADSNTGKLTPGSALTNLFTALTGWAISGQACILIGPWLQFNVNFTRSGADITVPANGDVANANVAQLSSAYTVLNGGAACSSSYGRGAFGTLAQGNPAVLTLASLAGSGNFVTGAGASLGGIVPVSY